MKLFATSALLAIAAPFADATFTIAGVHPKTGEMGAAGCTCVDPNGAQPLSLFNVNYHSTPGKGLLLSQASAAKTGNAVFSEADKLLKQDADPATILSTIGTAAVDSEKGLDPDFNLPYHELRQYGLVNSKGDQAGYTGKSIATMYSHWAFANLQPNVQEDKQGKTSSGKMAYTAQGNIVSTDTVPMLEKGFQQGNDTEACLLADRLYNALIAVDDANNKARANPTASPDSNFVGDVRCENGIIVQGQTVVPGYGHTGLQAYLHVEDKAGNQLLHIESLPVGGVNPIEKIRTEYAIWRSKKQCPVTRKLRGRN